MTEVPVPTQCPRELADTLVSQLIEQKAGSLLSDGYSFSIRTFLKLLLLLSVGDIKELVRLLLASIIPLIKRSPMLVLMLYSKVREFRIDRAKPTCKLLHEYTPANHKLVIDVNDQFMFALYSYVTNTPSCNFERSVSRAAISNMKDRYTTETISGIQVGKVTVMDRFDYNISMLTGEPVRLSLAAEHIKGPIIRSYTDLFSKGQQKTLIEYEIELKKKITHEKFMNRIQINSDTYSELDIAKMVVLNYPSLNLEETCYTIGTLFRIWDTVKGERSTNACVQRMKAGLRCFFDPNHYYVFNTDKGSSNSIMTISQSSILGFSNRISNNFTYLFDNHSFEQADKPEPESKHTEPELKQITIEIPYTESAESMNLILKDFVDGVCQYQRSDASTLVSIKIYCLLLETKVSTTEIPNPKYNQWLEQKKVLEEYRHLTDEIGYQAPKVDISAIVIPPPTISVETSSKVIVNKLLNETKKSLDTLYLRKADANKLLTSLDQFRNKKAMLEALGLPNKLNILLYGLPGTGKSTAIQAVATYLGRDIYYLDLKNAVTNQDLQAMFEYVNKNVKNGGIIVIEDIDAMTDVVLKREATAELRVNQLISSGEAKLSLEYLLNILQGTLTLDDSIFIVTTNHIDHLDPAFYRDGRFDVKIELKLTDHYQIQSIYHKFLNRQIPEHLLMRIPENVYSPATIIFHIKDYLFAPEVSDEVIVARFIDQD